MGMFDYVEYSAPCKKCGSVITEWQSKSGECSLDHLKPSEVTGFYGSCPKCETWHEYKVIAKEIEIVLVRPVVENERA